jgi:hypothetical protein
MNVSRQHWLTSLGVVLVLSGVVCAQPSTGSPERHDLSSLGMPANGRAAQAILAEKLGKAQPIKNLDKLEQLARQLKNGEITREELEDLAKLAENINVNKGNLTDEQKARLQKDLKDVVKDLKRRPEVPKDQVDQIEKQIESAGSGSAGSRASSGSGSTIDKHEPPQGSGDVPPPGDGITPPREEVIPPTLPEPPPKREDNKRSSDLTSKLAEQLFGKGGLLARSNLTRMIGSLTRPGSDDSESGEGSHLPSLYQFLHSRHGTGEGGSSNSLLGGASIPKVRGDSPEASVGVLDRAAGLGQFALVVVGMIALGAGLYLVLRLWKKGSDLAASAGWRLGPWPVNPAQVSTPEQFIRAFEYLAVLLLGREARHRNHRQIAAGLKSTAGAEGTSQRDAAEELAAIYEQARYAPVTEPLDGNQLAAARRDLILLAGHSAP